MFCMLFCVDLNKQLKLKKNLLSFFPRIHRESSNFPKINRAPYIYHFKTGTEPTFYGKPLHWVKNTLVNQFKPVFPVRRSQICTAPSQGQKCTRMTPGQAVKSALG